MRFGSISRGLLAMGLLAVASASSVLGDTPLPPPQEKTVWSPARKWCAVMDPRTDITTVYAVEAGERRTVAWSMMGWHRVAFLADDGEHLVIGHPGVNLLPRDARETDVLLYFVRKGELRSTVRLGEIVPVASLRPTASHLLWGSYGGLDAEGRMVLTTVEEKRFRFDVATGKSSP